MRISIIFITILFSSLSFAKGDQEVCELFKKYDQVMDQQEVKLIDEVFSQKFIKSSGGKKELIDKINSLKSGPEKAAPTPPPEISWKKGLKGEIYFVKMKETSNNKSKQDNHEAEFIVIEENGKLKIDGTISDGD